LLNRYRVKSSIEGSNPSLSAIMILLKNLQFARPEIMSYVRFL
jgi:hypothetical protein